MLPAGSHTSFREGTRFLVLLYSAENGRLLALIEADLLGMLRTHAAAGVASRHLAREDARAMALLGTGWQARGQAAAIACAHQLDQIRLRPGAAAPATARPLWGATACAAASRVSFTGFVPRARGARRHEGGERVLRVPGGQRRVKT